MITRVCGCSPHYDTARWPVCMCCVADPWAEGRSIGRKVDRLEGRLAGRSRGEIWFRKFRATPRVCGGTPLWIAAHRPGPPWSGAPVVQAPVTPVSANSAPGPPVGASSPHASARFAVGSRPQGADPPARAPKSGPAALDSALAWGLWPSCQHDLGLGMGFVNPMPMTVWAAAHCRMCVGVTGPRAGNPRLRPRGRHPEGCHPLG